MGNKEYIERGALLEICKRQIECEWNTLASPGTWAHAFEDFSDLVEQTPAADVVEVVRCKDCKYYKHFKGLYPKEDEYMESENACAIAVSISDIHFDRVPTRIQVCRECRDDFETFWDNFRDVVNKEVKL